MEMNRVPKAEMDPSIDMTLDRTRLFTVKDERSESHENIIEDSSFTSPNGSSESKSTRTFYIESLLVNRSSDKDFVSVGCSQPVPATSHVSYDNRAPSKSKKLKRKAAASTSFNVSSEMCLDPRSGYDGTFEEGCGLSTSLMEASNANKRARTIFTAEQLDKMEQEFHKQQYVVGHERMYLANALNLTEAQVKVWFQNRRIKWRKQHMISEQNKLYTIADSNSDDDPNQMPPTDPCPSHQLDQGN